MQQPEQPIGRPAAQLAGQSAVPGAHRTNASGHAGAATDVGLLRKLNQDALLVAHPVYVVADGMGGHAAGEVASALAIDQFAALAGRSLTPADAVAAIHDAIAAREPDRAERVLRAHLNQVSDAYWQAMGGGGA